MKRSRFSEEQIIGILREQEAGTITRLSIAQYILRHLFYLWFNKKNNPVKNKKTLYCDIGAGRTIILQNF